MNQPTILVTGATGHVGRPLIAALLADGARVRALTRDPAAAAVRTLIDPGHAGQTYYLTGPESLTQIQQAAAIGTAIGRPATTYAQWAAQHADACR